MQENYGIIVIDGDEIVLSIYIQEKEHVWRLLRQQSYDLATGIPGKHPASTEIVELIAGVLFTRYAATITDWRICARNLDEQVLKDVSVATGLPTELLTLQREQELLCKGILDEMK